MLDAYGFHVRLRRLRTLDSSVALFRSAIRAAGLDSFACGELDLAQRARTVYYVIDWPDKWRRFYMESGLVQRDPVVESLAYRQEAFTWSNLRRDRRLGKVGREGLALVATFGWSEGLVVPIPSIGRRVGLVSLVGGVKEPSAEVRGYLTLISLMFYYHIRLMVTHQGFATAPIGLTEREIDCVRLAAQGLSDKAIAARLGIATSTTHEYIEKAKRRLLTRTRTHMVAVAVALGIIDPFSSDVRRDPRAKRKSAKASNMVQR